jgi:peptide/nickel transport system substrate-binding protein
MEDLSLSTNKMRAKTLAVVAGSALILTGCGGDGEPDPGADAPPAGEETEEPTGEATGGEEPPAATGPFTYGYEQEFQSYNPNTAESNLAANHQMLQQVLEGFWYFGPDGSIVSNENFGTYEITSEDPFTVSYTIGDDVSWSDGDPFDCDDIMLHWAVTSGNPPTGMEDEEGNPIRVFSTAGTVGLEDSEPPTCVDGEKSFDLVYDVPYADYASAFGVGMMPAHIVEEQSGVADIIQPILDGDAEALAPAGEFYNTGWRFDPGTLQPEISPSLGPYQMTEWQAGQSLTFTADENYWGEPPASETVVVRYIAQDGQAQALQNNEIQAMDPQPNADLVAQLEALGDAVNVSTHDQYTYENFVFNFTSIFESRELREAFALCLPRQQMVDTLIVPQNPEAIVQNSRYVFPFEPEYQEVAEAIIGDEYVTQDIEGARAIVEAEGATGEQVRIGWATPNPRRVQQIALVTGACGPNGAGFDIVDVGADDFFSVGLPAGDFEIAMFAWATSPLVTASSSTFTTGGGTNLGSYSNPEVDALIGELNQTFDETAQIELIIQIETILWDDLATIPVFAFPAILATAANAEEVVYNATQAGLTWNMDEWTLT